MMKVSTKKIGDQSPLLSVCEDCVFCSESNLLDLPVFCLWSFSSLLFLLMLALYPFLEKKTIVCVRDFPIF